MDRANLSDVVLQTALVGNWKPYGIHQMGYIHSAMRSLIIANKLCRSTTNQSCIDHGLANRGLYSFRRSDPNPPIDSNYRGMQKQILDRYGSAWHCLLY